tara:strand:+ start:3359 stop:5608 length:2250 start_codon:yes stop_codon:yes gene_type:complete
MLNVIDLFPQIENDVDTFPRKFDWLESPYFNNSWTVLDPENVNNPDKRKLNFDGVLAPDLNFSDVDGLIDDMKKSLVVSVERGQTIKDFGGKVRSLSMMQHHVNCIKRLLRTVWNMGYQSISEVTDDDVEDIIDSFSKRESIALSLPTKLSQKLESFDLASIPVKHIDNTRMPATIDRKKIYLSCGINNYAVRNCVRCRDIIQNYHDKLSAHYKVAFEQTEPPKDKGILLNEKSFTENIKALRIFSYQSKVDGLFINPLKVDPKSINNDQISRLHQTLVDAHARKRTRNIEVETFLKLMDSAARYVVDYSDELFDLHDSLVSEQYDYESKSSPQKLMGTWLRNETQNNKFVSAPASPFPLSGLNTAIKGQSTFAPDISEKMIKLIAEGIEDQEIASIVGLTRQQVGNFRRNRKLYGRDLDTTRVSLYDAFHSYLPLSCTLILLAFTAGRESSVYGLKPDCIKETQGELWIEMYVHKTLRKPERFPAIALMQKAVDVLTRLSELHRKETGEATLFKFKSPLFKNTVGFRFDETISRFLKVSGLSDQFDNFNFSEHQFRRFFAIMYFYRYESGDFEALSHHLRHLTYEMTIIYLSEIESGAILKSVQDEKIKRLASRVQNNDTSISGPMADELVNDLKNQLITESEQHEGQVNLLAEGETDLVIDFPHARGICFGRTPRFIERAKCKVMREGEVLVSILSSSEALCAYCPNYLSVNEIKGNYVAQDTSDKIFTVGGNLLKAAIKKGVQADA